MKLAFLVSAALLAGSAGAQTVWRCGADGRTYSDTPCPGGRSIDAADSRDPAQVQAAHEVAARNRALARELTTERQQAEREAAARGSGLSAIQSSRPEIKPKTAKAKPKSKKNAPEAPEAFVGVAPESR